jgi:hypothetical protein
MNTDTCSFLIALVRIPSIYPDWFNSPSCFRDVLQIFSLQSGFNGPVYFEALLLLRYYATPAPVNTVTKTDGQNGE